VGVVHHEGVETFLPEVAAPAFASVDVTRVAPVGLGNGGAQAIAVGGYEDQVNVVGHEAVGEYGCTGVGAGLSEQVEIEPAVIIPEERGLAAIAALGDVMGMTGCDESGHPGHGFRPYCRWFVPACVLGLYTAFSGLGEWSSVYCPQICRFARQICPSPDFHRIFLQA